MAYGHISSLITPFSALQIMHLGAIIAHSNLVLLWYETVLILMLSSARLARFHSTHVRSALLPTMTLTLSGRQSISPVYPHDYKSGHIRGAVTAPNAIQSATHNVAQSRPALAASRSPCSLP